MAVLQDEGETPNVCCTVCRKLSDEVDTDKTINFSQKSLSDPGIKKKNIITEPWFPHLVSFCPYFVWSWI